MSPLLRKRLTSLLNFYLLNSLETLLYQLSLPCKVSRTSLFSWLFYLIVNTFKCPSHLMIEKGREGKRMTKIASLPSPKISYSIACPVRTIKFLLSHQGKVSWNDLLLTELSISPGSVLNLPLRSLSTEIVLAGIIKGLGAKPITYKQILELFDFSYACWHFAGWRLLIIWIYSFVFPLGFGCYLQSACEMCFHEFGKQKPSWVSAPGSAAADARAFGRRGCWQRPATLHVPVPASSSRLCSCDWSRCFVQFPQFWVSTTTSWSLACWFQGHHSETYLQPNPAPVPPSSPSSSSGCSLLPAPLIDGNAQSGCSSLIPNSHDAVFSCHE